MSNQLELALIANIVFGLAVIAAVRRPMMARTFLALSFLGSSFFNFYKLTNKANLALDEEISMLPLFKNYMLGFSEHLIYTVVLTIAIIQLVIAIGLVLHKRWTTAAMILGASYGLFVSSLGGYEFPAALLMSIAFLILAGNYRHELGWRWNQYNHQDNSISSHHRNVAG